MAKRMTLTELELRAVYLETVGKTADEIAADIGKDRATIFRWRKRPDYEAAVRELCGARDAELSRRLAESARKAVGVLEATLDSEDERLALDAAKTVLDRTGFSKQERVQVESKIEMSSGSPADELAKMLAGGVPRVTVSASNQEEGEE